MPSSRHTGSPHHRYMFTVYLVENPSGKIYIGYTSDLEARLKSHNMSEGKDWTQGRGLWKVIHTEKFETKMEAMQREKVLKSLKAGKRIKQILNITDTDI